MVAIVAESNTVLRVVKEILKQNVKVAYIYNQCARQREIFNQLFIAFWRHQCYRWPKAERA